jgi:hypothetical protein
MDATWVRGGQSVAFGLLLAYLSVNHQYVAGAEYAGNMCGPGADQLCLEPALQGGWPLSYIVDQLSISGVGYLRSVEDKFILNNFLFDVAFYACIVFALFSFFSTPKQVKT